MTSIVAVVAVVCLLGLQETLAAELVVTVVVRFVFLKKNYSRLVISSNDLTNLDCDLI